MHFFYMNNVNGICLFRFCRYAAAPQELRTDWNKFTKDYFLNRSTLVSVFLLIDASIPAKQIDLDYASWLGQNQVMFYLFEELYRRKISNLHIFCFLINTVSFKKMKLNKT